MSSSSSPPLANGPPPPPSINLTPAPLNASHLTHTLTPSPRSVPSASTIASSPTSICTDHMILASWNHTTGWSTPSLQLYAPLSLPPTASCLHYATTCFEGLKAYRGQHDGHLRLFRLSRNCARLGRSAACVSLPAPDPVQLAQLVRALLAVDAPRWLPADRAGSFLYVRPTLVGTQAQLGVQKPTEALLFIVASYMPALDSPSGGGLRLQTSPADAIRAWPGGFGHAKVGANYGPAVAATQEAAAAGFGQVLWLYGEGDDEWCTEAGGSNFFVVWRRKGDGKTVEVVTAPLGDGLILDGVTRGSCLELVRERMPGGQVEVVERRFGIGEVVEAGEEGRLLECFVAGTAWFICAVSQIRHRGQDIHIGMGPHGNGGEITTKIKGWLSDIMYGRVEHEWAEVVPEAVKQEQ